MKCELCKVQLKDLKGLSIHLSKKHKYDNDKMKEYYNLYLKKENEGLCYFCGNGAIYLNMNKGYHRICKSDECLSKTRATGTFYFLMYKYGLSEEDAKIEQKKRSYKRGKKIKEKFDELYNNDKNFHKKRSHQTIEFWINKGFSEEESKNKVKEVTDIIHKKTWDKRRKNHELYQDVNTTQLKYWIKKGFTEDEAKKKIKERQLTFTIEKCIEKYGEEEGIIVYNKRQQKWNDIMQTKYKNGEYQKFTKDNYSNNEIELMDFISNTLNINSYYGENQYFKYFSDIGKTFSYDFYYKKKIIEFNGDYWHCNPLKYNENYFNKHLKKTAKEIWLSDEIKINKIKEVGCDVLIIWESEYKKDKQKTIQKCIDFINKEYE